MKRRNERRPLAAERHVEAAEIGDGRDAGRRGQAIRVAELEREALGPLGLVVDGLAVVADRANLAGLELGFAEQVEHAVGEERAERGVEPPDLA